jgi:hypothetical protein
MDSQASTITLGKPFAIGHTAEVYS